MSKRPRIEEVLEAFDGDDAICIGCGCEEDDVRAGDRSWLAVDYALGLGVCSACPELLEEFNRGPGAALPSQAGGDEE